MNNDDFLWFLSSLWFRLTITILTILTITTLNVKVITFVIRKDLVVSGVTLSQDDYPPWQRLTKQCKSRHLILDLKHQLAGNRSQSRSDGKHLSGFHKSFLSCLDVLNIWGLQVANRSGHVESGLQWHVAALACRWRGFKQVWFLCSVPTVPVKNLNGSSPVHPALAGHYAFICL